MDNQPSPHLATDEPSPEAQSAPQATVEPGASQPTGATSALRTPNQPKPSRRKLWIIVGAVVILVVIGILTYAALSLSGTTTKTKPVSTSSTSNKSVNDLTSTFTDGANDESSITNTDDSAEAANMNQSAGNVGDSVNENNF